MSKNKLPAMPPIIKTKRLLNYELTIVFKRFNVGSLVYYCTGVSQVFVFDSDTPHKLKSRLLWFIISVGQKVKFIIATY